MTRHLVCDASAVVALLPDSGPDGRWAAELLTGADLAAPSLIAFEVANIIRRHERTRLVSTEQGQQAHSDLLDLPVEHWPSELIAARAWDLRRNLSSRDASYVALAELIGATPVTLDRRLARAPTYTARPPHPRTPTSVLHRGSTRTGRCARPISVPGPTSLKR